MSVERLEVLLSANWAVAMGGDVRAADACRRVIDVSPRLHGLYGGERRGENPTADDADSRT